MASTRITVQHLNHDPLYFEIAAGGPVPALGQRVKVTVSW